MWRSYEGVIEDGTIETLVDSAAKAPPEVSDELYARAAMKSLRESNDPERARKLAENIANPEQRASKVREIEQHIFSRAVREVNLDDASRHIPAAASIEERVSILIYLANVGVQKEQKAAARRLLEEAAGLIGGARPNNQSQFSSLLQVAKAYAAVDSARGFEIIESAIEWLNELLDAAALVDGFGADCFKDGELKLYDGKTWAALLTQCCEALSEVAPLDFERAFSTGGKLRRAEAHSLAILKVAQKALSESNLRSALK
jgi:hypothetical protein